jgi:hypothetical protein
MVHTNSNKYMLFFIKINSGISSIVPSNHMSGLRNWILGLLGIHIFVEIQDVSVLGAKFSRVAGPCQYNASVPKIIELRDVNCVRIHLLDKSK